MRTDAPSLPVAPDVLALAYECRAAEAGALRAALAACTRAFACGMAPDLPEWTLWLRLAAGDGAMAGSMIESTPARCDRGITACTAEGAGGADPAAGDQVIAGLTASRGPSDVGGAEASAVAARVGGDAARAGGLQGDGEGGR